MRIKGFFYLFYFYSSRSTLSTSTKFKNGTELRQNVPVLDLVPVLRAQKQAKFFFQKIIKMYLVPATNLKNKIKF
jgi:hypothetical protein